MDGYERGGPKAKEKEERKDRERTDEGKEIKGRDNREELKGKARNERKVKGRKARRQAEEGRMN